MKVTFCFCILWLLSWTNLLAQDNMQRYAFSVANDNDVYLLQRSDRYYTNGILFEFLMRLDNDSSKLKMLEIGLEHRLYNGVIVLEKSSPYWDRPHSAIFSLKSTFSQFIQDNKVFRLQVNFEQVGPKVQGKEIQRFIHNTFDMYEVSGWENQLPNKFGADIGLSYKEEYIKAKSFALSGAVNGVVGLNNIYFQAEIPMRLGRINAFNKSIFTKSHLYSEGDNNEFFVFYKPMVTYQVRNLSIYNREEVKGQLPNNAIKPILFIHQFGTVLSKGRSTFMLSVFSSSTELKRMKYKSHQYARLQYGIMF